MRKFKTLLNPFGILYNPVSVAQSLMQISKGRIYQKEDLIEHEGIWSSFAHHGRFSGTNPEKVLENINQAIKSSREFLLQSKVLICTLGTAYVFEYKPTGKIVGNCHKLPNSDFNRKRLTVEEMVEPLKDALESLHSSNDQLKIILTVSPVRHIRDGLIENQRSKAALLLAVDELCQNNNRVEYFPSYELLMDDLRDYRFYEADLIHPNQQAIDYIWNAFSDTYFPEVTQKLNTRIEKLVQASRHRPIHPQSRAHQEFIRRQLEKIDTITSEYPHLSFDEEKELFLKDLVDLRPET